MAARPYVDEDKCITCGQCEQVCPADPNVFEMKDKAKVVEPQACIECRACESACPTEAIVVKE